MSEVADFKHIGIMVGSRTPRNDWASICADLKKGLSEDGCHSIEIYHCPKGIAIKGLKGINITNNSWEIYASLTNVRLKKYGKDLGAINVSREIKHHQPDPQCPDCRMPMHKGKIHNHTEKDKNHWIRFWKRLDAEKKKAQEERNERKARM